MQRLDRALQIALDTSHGDERLEHTAAGRNVFTVSPTRWQGLPGGSSLIYYTPSMAFPNQFWNAKDERHRGKCRTWHIGLGGADTGWLGVLGAARRLEYPNVDAYKVLQASVTVLHDLSNIFLISTLDFYYLCWHVDAKTNKQ